MLIVHSPRLRDGASYRRRSQRDMRYFVLRVPQQHAQHRPLRHHLRPQRQRFVPLYMASSRRRPRPPLRHRRAGRPLRRRQPACHDKGSAGAGVEVAKDTSDELQPLQALGRASCHHHRQGRSPQLAVVHHRGVEGLPMLNALQRRLAILREQPEDPRRPLPFMPAHPERVARANASLHDLITSPRRLGRNPRRQCAFLPPRGTIVSATGPMRATSGGGDPVPVLVAPLRLATRPAPPMPSSRSAPSHARAALPRPPRAR